MANLISVQLLRNVVNGLPNRDDLNRAKVSEFGGFERPRVSPQNQKYYLRQNTKKEGLKTSHLEDLIELVLKEMVGNGTISEDKIDFYGSEASKYLGCKWEERESVKSEKDKTENKKEDNNKESGGRTVVSTNKKEVMAVVNALIENDNLPKEMQKNTKAAVEKALENVGVSVEKALYGSMTADKQSLLPTIQGAFKIGHAYGIGEHKPEYDYITANATMCDIDDSDPCSESFKKFYEMRKRANGAETIANGELYSNTMFEKSFIDVGLFRSNLSKNIRLCDIDLPEEDLLNEMKDGIGDCVYGVINTVSGSKQNSCLSSVLPAITYIECIKEGTPHFADCMFEKKVRRCFDECGNEKSITEQGIERILEYLKDQIMKESFSRNPYKINRYVMLTAPYYNQFVKDFEELGITIFNTPTELQKFMEEETERLA